MIGPAKAHYCKRERGYLSFSDIWYLATVSRHCKSLANQIFWNKHRLDFSRPQLNTFNHILHSALAYIDRYGYNDDTIDHTVLQSVSNRLAVEFYDRTPLKNWEPCLDFFLDKTLGITLDHVLLDASLDIVPNLPLTSDFQTLSRPLDENTIAEYSTNSSSEFFFLPTRKGRLITAFLTTLFPTLTALFDTEKTTEIHHRLLLNHINRHLDNLINRYHSHYKRRLSPLVSSSTRSNVITQHQNQVIRLRFRIIIRFVGTLVVQTELLSPVDLNVITRQRIQTFFSTLVSPTATTATTTTASSSKNDKHYNMLWLDETEFQMSILLDMMRALLSRHSSDWDSSYKELQGVTTLLNNTVSALSKKKESVIPQQEHQISKKRNTSIS
ncbi:hypothetical protein K501DRAFT_336801 [Backusella circina FSU 941]|nr:hypothetical protein K501DRAFT_336801 [Backusella circina FSU 941]